MVEDFGFLKMCLENGINMVFIHRREESDHWIEWGCHTNFSFLVGAGYPAEHVDRADKLCYEGLGICDFDGVYGLAKAHLTAQKIKKKHSDQKLNL